MKKHLFRLDTEQDKLDKLVEIMRQVSIEKIRKYYWETVKRALKTIGENPYVEISEI
jgi:hypothetical protein